MTEQVYFVRAGRRIKIGFTSNLSQRLLALQTGSGEVLTLLAAIPGGARLEKAFHVAFAQSRRTGEWFDGSLLELVVTLIAAGAQPKNAGDIRALCEFAMHESRLNAAKQVIESSSDHEELKAAHILSRLIQRARNLHSFKQQ